MSFVQGVYDISQRLKKYWILYLKDEEAKNYEWA
jgi:hypothetical protein